MSHDSAVSEQATPSANKNPSEAAYREYTRGSYYKPKVDILELPDELVVLADMPGLEGDDVDINFENGELTIHGRVKPRQPAGASCLLEEYGVGDFFRAFQVSEKVDAMRIAAEYSQGVLTLHLPKVEAARARKISVRTA